MIKVNETELKVIRRFENIYRVVAVMVCLLLIAVLLSTVSGLPSFGDAGNPANNEVYLRYVEKGLQETGATNIVAGIILDYRAFDTFGESVVLFTAICMVMMILGRGKADELPDSVANCTFDHEQDQILRITSLFLVPPIFLLGIYIILNGHLSPGGGFSGGAVMGAGLILYACAFGFKKIRAFFTLKIFHLIIVSALLFYALAKGYSFYTGANHIPSGIPLGIPGNILSGGLILPLNIAVGLIVACTIYGIYAMYSRGGLG